MSTSQDLDSGGRAHPGYRHPSQKIMSAFFHAHVHDLLYTSTPYHSSLIVVNTSLVIFIPHFLFTFIICFWIFFIQLFWLSSTIALPSWQLANDCGQVVLAYSNIWMSNVVVLCSVVPLQISAHQITTPSQTDDCLNGVGICWDDFIILGFLGQVFGDQIRDLMLCFLVV